jgi:1,4-alpha-glucan branching enzyme
MRGDLVFVFNFNPFKSFDDYGILAPGGSYETVLSSDNPDFGGYGNIDESIEHLTQNDPLYSPHGVEWLKLYLPARTAMVLRKRQ